MQLVKEAIVLRVSAMLIALSVVALGAQPLLKATAGILS